MKSMKTVNLQLLANELVATLRRIPATIEVTATTNGRALLVTVESYRNQMLAAAEHVVSTWALGPDRNPAMYEASGTLEEVLNLAYKYAREHGLEGEEAVIHIETATLAGALRGFKLTVHDLGGLDLDEVPF